LWRESAARRNIRHPPVEQRYHRQRTIDQKNGKLVWKWSGFAKLGTVQDVPAGLVPVAPQVQAAGISAHSQRQKLHFEVKSRAWRAA